MIKIQSSKGETLFVVKDDASKPEKVEGVEVEDMSEEKDMITCPFCGRTYYPSEECSCDGEVDKLNPMEEVE